MTAEELFWAFSDVLIAELELEDMDEDEAQVQAFLVQSHMLFETLINNREHTSEQVRSNCRELLKLLQQDIERLPT